MPTTAMTKDDIQLLYEYDRSANNRVLQAASTLSAEEFTRDLGGSFRSVRDTLVHIVGGAWGWLTCWKEPSPSSSFVTDLWTRHDALFSPNAFSKTAARCTWPNTPLSELFCVSNDREDRNGGEFAKSISSEISMMVRAPASRVDICMCTSP
jgi:DinB family